MKVPYPRGLQNFFLRVARSPSDSLSYLAYTMNVKHKYLIIIASTLSILLSGCASINSADANERMKAVRHISNPAILARVACEDSNVGVRTFAVHKLNDQSYLAKVSCEAKDWDIRKVAFNRLDSAQLTTLSQTAKDPAVLLAARIKIKQSDWNSAFKPGNLDKAGMGNVLGAVALVNSPQPSSASVVAACHAFIRKGDSSRIPELKDLLLRFGDKPLAEDYLNCGQSQLHAAGVTWANQHGYDVGSGDGSHRVQWGGQ